MGAATTGEPNSVDLALTIRAPPWPDGHHLWIDIGGLSAQIVAESFFVRLAYVVIEAAHHDWQDGIGQA